MQPKLKNQTSDLSLNGLEELLDSTNDAPDAEASDGTVNGGKLSSQDWSVEETARALGLSRGAVIRRLEDGIFPGYRVKRSYGWAWRVKPVWLADSNDSNEEVQDNGLEISSQNQANARVQDRSEPTNESQAKSEDHRDSQEFVEVFDAYDYDPRALPAVPSASFRELIELKTKLEMTEFQFQDAYAKLETANYKIGYLEARLEASQEQVKLLSDSRRFEPWWQRWRQWFTTVKE